MLFQCTVYHLHTQFNIYNNLVPKIQHYTCNMLKRQKKLEGFFSTEKSVCVLGNTATL